MVSSFRSQVFAFRRAGQKVGLPCVQSGFREEIEEILGKRRFQNAPGQFSGAVLAGIRVDVTPA